MTVAPLIAVVEDEPVSSTMLKRLLEKSGFGCEVFADGASFLERVKTQHFSVVLLDIILGQGEENGIAICRQLREHYSMNELPILMVTAKTEDRVFLESLEAGANDFVSKPISPITLVARVRTQLRMAQAAKDLIVAQNRMSAQQRLEALGIFAMGVAHHLNNALGIIQGSAEMLHRLVSVNPKQQRLAEMVIDATKRSATLISNLSVLSTTCGSVVCDAFQVCQSTLNLVRSLVRDRITFSLADAAPGLMVAISNADLATVLTYVLKNAIDSIPGTGTVHMTVFPIEGHRVRISVQHSGPPLDPAVRDRLFEPFFCRDGQRESGFFDADKPVGLGLWSAWQIVNHAGGTLRMADSNLERTIIELELPEGATRNTENPTNTDHL